jgi:hypothetical protein
VRSRHWVALDRPGHFTSRAESEKVRIEVAVRIIEGDALVVEHAGPARSPAASSEAHQLTERLAGVDIRRTLRIGDEVLIVGYAGSEPIVLSTKPHAHAVELPVAACKPAPRFPESGVSR